MNAIWNRWKYLLTLSLFFLLMYGFLGVLDPTPTVNLPGDVRLLLNDRHRLHPPSAISVDVPVIVESKMQAVVASGVLYPGGDWRNDDNRRNALDSKSAEVDAIRNKPEISQMRDSGIIKQDKETVVGRKKADRRKLGKWTHGREIVGNEHFVNRFQSGIQKPEDFYERNRDAVVKIQRNEHTSSTTRSKDEKHANTRKPQIGEDATDYSTHWTTGPPFSFALNHQLLSRMKNGTLSNKTQPSNVTTDVERFTHRRSNVRREDGPFREGNGSNSESVFSSLDKGSPNSGVRYTKTGSKRKVRRKPRVNGTTLADLASAPYPPLIVKATGAFLDRVRVYNEAIATLSAEILKRRGFGPWRDVADPERLNVVWGNTDDFLERLSQHDRAKTVLLPWSDDSGSNSQRSNALVGHYYAWSATSPLCAWIMTPGFTKARWDAVYDRECNEDMAQAALPARSLEFMYFYAKPINVNHYWPNYGTVYPAYFYRRPPPHVFYAHLLQDAVVNAVGDVISGDLKLVPYTCSHDNLPTVPNEYPQRPVYREVFVMTQFWGQSFFHKIVEVMPRVAPYVEFLRANPGVQIHAPEDRSQVSEMLRMIGIDPVRIVTGITRAKLVYLPQGTPCGFPDARSIQLLSALFRDHIRSKHRGPRNRLIYVRRSGLRRFAVGAPIEFVLQAIAERRRLNYTVFGDRPTPPLSTAAELFNSAVAVVGPHGAGLSNVVFSEPGTALIEGVCNEPHVNMCYQMTAHMLGLRYHGIPSRGGCERVIDVTASDVETAVEAYVDMVLSDMKRQPQR